jgi:hypothetical protein
MYRRFRHRSPLTAEKAPIAPALIAATSRLIEKIIGSSKVTTVTCALIPDIDG